MLEGDAIHLCRKRDLESGRAVTRWLDEIRDEVTAFEWHGELTAFSTVCPHFGGEMALDRGRGEIACKWHGFRFRVGDGASCSRPLKAVLRRYRLHVDGEEVYVVRPVEGR